MGKWDKEYKARLEGMVHAYEEIKEHGLSFFEDELKMRQRYGVKALISKKEMEEFRDSIVDDCYKITLVVAIATLSDEFDFDTEQLKRFVARYNLKSDSMAKDDVNFLEIINCVAEETGIKVKFKEN